ncbi:MAG: FAD binding domain-containing protein [Rubrobacteraceae bacterium]|nr:FAD binding domain-containing protein [Rubrobacteraceae bacterium]
MEFLQPATWHEALEARAEHPEARPIFGGTDVMVELNFDRDRPGALLDLTRIPELSEWGEEDGMVRIGAGVSYARIIEEVGGRLPALAMASRTVGSPQIRNRGTVGGNLGTSSPAGDSLPPLYAAGAEVEVCSVRGVRRVSVEEFVRGPKRNALAGDELISAVVVPVARGPEQFSKIGTRNAMVIAVCSLAVSLDVERRKVRACIGSAGPTPIRAREAEGFIEGVLDEEGLWESRGEIGEEALGRFAELVREAARPIDDVRSTAEYRRHAVGVLARRELAWVWQEYRGGEAR